MHPLTRCTKTCSFFLVFGRLGSRIDLRAPSLLRIEKLQKLVENQQNLEKVIMKCRIIFVSIFGNIILVIRNRISYSIARTRRRNEILQLQTKYAQRWRLSNTKHRSVMTQVAGIRRWLCHTILGPICDWGWSI